MITSNKNSDIKYLRSLEKKKYREREKVFVAEGIRIIEDALADGAKFIKVFYAPMLELNSRGLELLEDLRSQGVEEVLISNQLFNQVAGTETPQGLLAILEQPQYGLDDLLGQESMYPHLMMINGVQDPGNLGTILRTTAGAGWAGVMITKGTVDLYNPKSLRATMGAVHKLPIYRIEEDLDPLWDQLKERGYQVIATSLEGEVWHFQVDFRQPTVLIVGNEGNGVESELLEAADQLVKIPMAPHAESLNVAIATGVLVFEGVRQNLVAGI